MVPALFQLLIALLHDRGATRRSGRSRCVHAQVCGDDKAQSMAQLFPRCAFSRSTLKQLRRPPYLAQRCFATGSKEPEGAFDKGLPFLFKSNASLITLTSMLVAVGSYNAYLDATALPDSVQEAEAIGGENAARLLPDGRVLMKDGSIVRRPPLPKSGGD